MKLYAIRHKPSGRLMPAVKGRGSTALNFHLNGFELEFARHKLRPEPRLFALKIAAQRALAAWLKGEWTQHASGGRSPFDDDYDVYTAPPDKPPSDRKAEDIELVEFRLTEIGVVPPTAPPVPSLDAGRNAKTSNEGSLGGKGL